MSSDLDAALFGEIDPPQRLLMGPGPVNAHPRVLRAMSADLLGQFDPEMTAYMNQVMALYRPIFGTSNRWTMLIDGTARSAIEAALISLVVPGDRVLVVNFGRFGLLLTEILSRIGATIETVDASWGEVVPMDAIAQAIERLRHRRRCVAMHACHDLRSEFFDGMRNGLHRHHFAPGRVDRFDRGADPRQDLS